MCPFCEWRPRPASETPADDRVGHITSFHRDRLAARAAFEKAIANGADERIAWAAHNAVLAHRGPGQYDRSARRARTPQAVPA